MLDRSAGRAARHRGLERCRSFVKSENPHIGQLTLPRQSFEGSQPAMSTPYELIVNLKTARNIGVTTPPEVLKRADRVIQ